MKKKLLTAGLIGGLIFSTNSQKLEAKSIDLIVEDEYVEMDSEAINENGRVLVPLRAIFNSLGVKDINISWNAEKREVQVEQDDVEIQITIDSNLAYVNGKEKKLDVPARIIQDRTLLPTRFIAETFKAKVGWDQASKTVLVNSSPDSIVRKAYNTEDPVVYEELLDDYLKTETIEKRMGGLNFVKTDYLDAFNDNNTTKYKASTDFGSIVYIGGYKPGEITSKTFKTYNEMAHKVIIDRTLDLGEGFLRGIKVGDSEAKLLSLIPKHEMDIYSYEYIYMRDVDGGYYTSGDDYLSKMYPDKMTYSAARPDGNTILIGQSVAMSDYTVYSVEFNIVDGIIRSIELKV